uniref:SAM domain-containing protein n=1 Tax=Stegastes partitus TaxID=144197 RepID=A0A3B5A6I1_9TELE
MMHSCSRNLSLQLCPPFCPGGSDVAEEFRSQEIDGQALLLLTEDHLVSTMNLKLGPALKLCHELISQHFKKLNLILIS